MNENKKAILMILDGWGIGKHDKADVIDSANTINYHNFLKQYPHSQLLACGENVGLPDGQMGNSEVGHLNIGAGRIVYQDYGRINNAIASGEFFKNEKLNEAFDYAIKNSKQVHLLGLVSNGGVHSSDKHLEALIKMSDKKGCEQTFVHALTDGRETDPKSGIGFVKGIVDYMS
ncbi:MAG: 2,3-bisphosphoglycerate-independent phosphoglycerate mutase, partial [Bacteroidales bacterium]|nr:2,3-bisphosphoglycerate-independent phosphoglycerate mutase [Bacteroidales bacterium]